MKWWLVGVGIVTIGGCAGGTDSGVGAGASAATRPPVVHTAQGDVQAKAVSQGIAEFEDVPYAAPPTGALRFMPPAPRAAWSGVFVPPATSIRCLSTTPSEVGAGAGLRTAPSAESEDCLYLDVYAPAVKPSSPLPVVFYLHGGFGLWGAKDDIDGTELAKFGNVIVVSANYRLGALGYLAHPALTAEQGSSGNYAHLDQIAALRWVQDNIAQFGGDPARVTLSGQSWGGQSTCVLMASPLARGLFSRAFDISGAGCLTASQADAFTAGQSVATKLHCAGPAAADVAACLRGKSAESLLGGLTVHLWTSDYRWRATVDGHLLPAKAQALLDAGAHNHVPLVIGTTSEEASSMTDTIFPPSGSDPIEWTLAKYKSAVAKAYGALAPRILDLYPASSFEIPFDAMVAVLSDDRFICPARRVARAVSAHQTEPVRRYVFELTGALATTFGNGHRDDLDFYFHVAHELAAASSHAVVAPTRRTEDDIAGYFSRFAATGDPNRAGALAWPVYDRAADNAIVFDDPPHLTQGIRTSFCDFWDSLTPDP